MDCLINLTEAKWFSFDTDTTVTEGQKASKNLRHGVKKIIHGYTHFNLFRNISSICQLYIDAPNEYIVDAQRRYNLKRVSLVGKTFARLTVLEQYYEDGVRYCICRCVCGKIVTVRGGNLISKRQLSCGCIRFQKRGPMKKRSKFIKDLTGQVFSRLKVIGLASEKYPTDKMRSRTLWDCVCECGNRILVPSERLRKGKTRSCGCLDNEETGKRGAQFIKHTAFHISLIDGTGVFHLLLALGYNSNGRKKGVIFEKKRGIYRWHAISSFKGNRKRVLCNDYKSALEERLKMEKEDYIPFIMQHKDLLPKHIDTSKYLNAQPTVEFNYETYENERNMKLREMPQDEQKAE